MLSQTVYTQNMYWVHYRNSILTCSFSENLYVLGTHNMIQLFEVKKKTPVCLEGCVRISSETKYGEAIGEIKWYEENRGWTSPFLDGRSITTLFIVTANSYSLNEFLRKKKGGFERFYTIIWSGTFIHTCTLFRNISQSQEWN